MTEIDLKISSEYGIMFLYDSKNAPDFPNEAGRYPVTWTINCIAFSVLSYVDGDARVTLSETISNFEGKECFSGNISCPSKSISLYDHNGFAFASVPLRDRFAQLKLIMSEERNPYSVRCVISNMVSY